MLTFSRFCAIILLFSTFSFPFFYEPFSFAQEVASKTQKIKLAKDRNLILNYNAPGFNKDPKNPESLVVLVRDANSGKMLLVEIIESAPNSHFFEGNYHFSFSDETDFVPEIYIPSKKLADSKENLQKINQYIKDGILLRKPFFYRSESRFTQTISIHDSKEQAVDAYNNFRKNQQGQPIIDRAALEAQRLAQAEVEKKKQVEELTKKEAERKKSEEEEKKKKEENVRKQAMMAVAEKQKREKEAKIFAEKAMVEYHKGNFVEAEGLFEKSIELDPNNNKGYYQYGVTLYKNEKFNKSLIVLRNSTVKSDVENEKNYFMALNHMKLKEFEPALKYFETIKKTDDKTLAPSAAFYAGVIEFQKESYDKAKEHFEFVLDKSEDKKMDQQSEMYIEQIANIKMFLANKAKRLLFTFNGGLMFDSNILSQATGNATDLAGYRGLYGGSIEYRPVYNERHEFSGIINYNEMLSTDASFKAKDSFLNTDPLSTSIGLNYKYKGKAFNKPLILGLVPSYEMTNMDVDGNKSKEKILTSTALKVDQTYIMNEDWFSQYIVEFRSDVSGITTTEDENQTANKLTLSTTNTLFRDKKKTEAFIYDAGLSLNNALGKNQTYQRLDLAGSYMMPWKWETSFISKINLSQVIYSQHVNSRSDTGAGLSLTLRKPFGESMALNLVGNYNHNKSTITNTNSYDKYSILTLFNWNGAL